MAKLDDLKKLLANKYDKKIEHLEDTTSIADIIGGDHHLAAHIKEAFDKELSVSELENASNISELANLL
jgi:3-oxoacyl-ACP reductase-like protein